MHHKTPSAGVPCWHCGHFLAIDRDSGGAACLRAGGALHAAPSRGCAFVDRVPGIDDEPGPPAPMEWAKWRPIMLRALHRQAQQAAHAYRHSQAA